MKRVIVADDHSLFRDGITSLLEAAGYDVVEQVGDGELAVEAVKRLNPDLVLLDITMPRMNGVEALQIIKGDFPKIRVVMLTVSDEDEDLYSAIQSGADGYLLKDLNSKEFLEMLRGLEIGGLDPLAGLAESDDRASRIRRDITERGEMICRNCLKSKQSRMNCQRKSKNSNRRTT